MEHQEKRLALRRWKRGNPLDIIRLYTAEIANLKQEFTKASCQGCARGFYERKIKKYSDEIRQIREEKRFRNFDFSSLDKPAETKL